MEHVHAQHIKQDIDHIHLWVFSLIMINIDHNALIVITKDSKCVTSHMSTHLTPPHAKNLMTCELK